MHYYSPPVAASPKRNMRNLSDDSTELDMSEQEF